MRSVEMARKARLAVACLLGATALTPFGAAGQTWQGGTGTDFNTGANWSTGTPPTNAQTGTFGNTANTTITVTTDTTVGGLAFSVGASPYTLTITDATFAASTITNSSGATQTINVVNNSVPGNMFVDFNGGDMARVALNVTGLAHVTLRGVDLDDAVVTANTSASVDIRNNSTGGSGTRFVVNAGGSIGLVGVTLPSFTVGSIAGAGDIFLHDVTLVVGSNNEPTVFSGRIRGSIDGVAGLTKEGVGTLTLSGASTYSGGTTISDGTISISANNNLGSAGGVLALGGGTLQTTATFSMSRATTLNTGGGTFNVAGSTILTQGGDIGGTGGLTKSGTGTLVLTSASTYQGGTTFAGGVLSVSADTNLGQANGALRFLSGGTLRTTATFAMSRATTLLTGSGAFDVASGTTLTQNGVISGPAGFTKIGAGTLVLTAVNTYQGGTTINGGTLSVVADNRLGSGALTFGGGTLQTTADISMSRATTLNAAGGTFEVASSTTLIQNGVIGGAGGLTKTGAGTLTLAGINTYQGGTTINEGTLFVSSNDRLGDANGGLTFGGGTLMTIASFTTSRATTLNAGGGIFQVALGTTLIHDGNIDGAGGLTKTGAGTLILTNINPYQGGTTINGGTLSVVSDNRLGDASGTLAFGGGTLQTTAHITMSRATTVNAGGGTFDVAGGTFLTQEGIIGGGGALTKTGGGTLTLTADNDYSGDLQVNGGTLALAGSGSLRLANTLVLDGTGAGTVFDISSTTSGATIGFLADVPSGPPLASTAVIRLGTKTLTITGQLQFTGVIQSIGGSLGGGLTLADGASAALSGANTYTGATTIGAGALLELDDNGSIANSSAVNLTGTGAIFDISCGCDNSQTIKDLSGVSGSLVLLGQNSLTVGTSNSTTFEGQILAVGGNGGLIKQGSGTLTLTGTNDYTGGTTITGGLINFTTLDNFGTGNVTLNGGGVQWATGNTIDISPRLEALGSNGGTFDTNGNDVTLATGISGTGGLTKAGLGTLTLEEVNLYTGATTISGGTLALANNGDISSSSLVTVASGATFDISASSYSFRRIQNLAGVGTVQLGNRGLVIQNASGEFGGAIIDSGTGGGVHIAAGTMTFTGVSTYRNVTEIMSGATLALKGAGSIAHSRSIDFLSAGGGNAVFDISQTTAGAAVKGLRDTSGSGIVRLGGQTLTITGGPSTFNGVLQDGGLGGGTGGGLTLAVNALLNLRGANTYTGATTIGQDALLMLANNGSIAASSGVTLAAVGATLDITNSSGNQTIKDLAGIADTKVVIGGHTLTVGTGNSTGFAGTIADDELGGSLGGSLVKVGSGTLTLGGINAYTGTTTIGAGTLALSSADISASSMVIVGTGATFDVSDNVATQITALTGSGTVKLGSSAGLIIASASGEFSGVITSDLCGCSTFAIGSGVQTLSGANTYTGITVLAAGATLALKGAGSIASSTGVEFVPFGPGVATFDISQVTTGATVLGLADLDGVGVVSLGLKTLTVGANGGPFAGIIQDGGIAGGTGGGLTVASPGFGLQLAGTNTYTGATTIESDGLLAIVGPGSIAQSSGVSLAAAGATFDISGSGGGQTIRDLSGVGATTIALGSNSLTVGTAASTVFAGVIADFGFYGGTGGSLVKQGSGTLTLTGANTYTGGTTINGGAIAVSADASLGAGNGGLAFNGGTLRFLSNFDLAGSRAITLGAGGGTIDTNGFSTTIAQSIDGAGGLTKTGGGTLTLSGVNTYGGGTTINGGTLSISQDANLGAAGSALAFGGGTLQTTADITMSRATTLDTGGGTFDVAASTTLTQNGIIGGNGGLTKSGSGTLVLTENSSYTGGTTISGGILQLGNGGTIGSIVGNVVNNGVLAFNRADNITFAGDISGSGAVAYMGPGTVTLTGASTYTGGTAITGGTVQAGSDSAFGTAGALTLMNGTLQATATFIIFRSITLAAPGGTFDTNGNTLTVQGAITGDGGLTKTGSGTLELAGVNTYTGATTINAGTLALVGAGSIAALSSIALTASGATFDISGASGNQTIQDLTGVAGSQIALGNNSLTVGTATSTTFSGTIGGAGGLIKQGSGTLTLEGNSGYAGATTINAGTLAIIGGGVISYSSVTVAGGATFDISGSDYTENLITDLAGGGRVKLGSNQLVVNTATGVFSGSMVDAGAGRTRGALTIVDGILTLSGVSTYGGITQIYQGATLALTGAGSIANTLYVAFSPLSSGGEATFDISGTTGGATVGGLRDTSSAGLGHVVLGSQTLTVTGSDGAFKGIISGNGGLALAASATQALAGVNSYAGATTIGAGATLLLYDNGSIAASSGVNLAGTDASFDISGANGGRTIQDLAGGAGTTIFLGSNSLTVGTANNTTFAGEIADDGFNGGSRGSLVKQGSGTLTLTGANTYTGGTTVLGGTLVGTTTSLQRNIVNNATVVFDQGTNGIYAGNMSGTGSLTKTGTGNVTLTGTNTYSGGTTVSGGTLTGNTTSLQGDIANNAAVVFNQTTTGTYAGIMSGTGSLTKTGAGTLILTANNTYTGDTIISGGILQLGNGGTTGMIAGDVFNFGTLAFNRSDNIVFAGNISGSGNIAYMGPGTVTLTGTNTYTGGTAITGGTVQAGSDSALGAAGTTLTMINGTLQATASFTIARPIILTTPGGTFDTNGNTLTLQGAISGTGGLTKIGAGTLILDGTNSYTGGTTVTAGILQGTTSSLQRNIVNNAAVVFDQDTDGSYGSIMSGTGSLTKTGAGNVTLTGTNSYSGGTTVSGGTLTGSTTNLQGNIVNNATVVFDQDTNGTFAGAVSGTGGLTKTGFGNVTLTGTNSYSGGTTVLGGALTGNTTSLQGNILNNAAVVFSQGTDGNYAGVMSGTGGLIKSGAGNFTLSGANSYSGGTTVSGGTLTGTTASLQGNILNNAAVAFTGAGGTYAGAMTGTGSLNVSTTGLLILSGANAYSGGTTITNGTLQGNATSLQGNIVNNAALIFDQASTGTYAGVLSGTGSLTKTGAGQLIFTGNNVVGGGTTVSAGLLTVNGSLTSNTTIAAGAMIGGSGTIFGQLTSNGGVLAPGNSIGTMNVAGSFVQNGGVYQVEVNSGGQSDKIVATGTATIGGGATVQVLAASGTYARNTTYTIVTATGGLTGTYGGVSSNLAFLTPSLSYDANNVYLLLAQTASAFASGAQTFNERAVGNALDIASPTATGDFDTVLNALAALDTQQGPAALNTISGQPYTGFGTVNIGASMVFMNALGQQVAVARGGVGAGTRVALAEACVVACDTMDLPKWGAWMSGLGGFGSVGGNTNAGTLTYNLGGAAVGVDYRLDPRFLVGLAVGYSSGRQWVNGFQGNGNADNYSAALYASFNQGGLYVDALAGYAYSDNRMQRVMAIPGMATRIANGQVGANQFLGQIEAGYRVGILDAARATITPFARFQTVAVAQNAFNESGAQSLNLNVTQQNTTSVRTIIGADLGANIPVGMERPLGVTIRLGWAHEYADTARPMTAAFAGAPTVGFTVYGAQPLRDAAVIGLGLNAQIGASTSIYARYDGEITGRDDTHSLSAGFRMTW